MQHNEMNDIYSGETQEVQEVHAQNPAELAAQFMRRQNLPKFKLGENEDFYIPREKLADINRTYFQMLDDMQEGFSITPEALRSYMESVVFASYRGTIEEIQRKGEIDGIHKKEVYNAKLTQMTPAYVRRWYQFKSRPNLAMSLCLKEAELEAEIENSIYREQIAKQELILYGEPDTNDEQSEENYVQKNVQELFDTFIDTLVPKRKRKRFIKKNGEYLNGLLEEFIRRQRAMVKLSQKRTEGQEAELGEPEDLAAEPTDEAQTATEQVSDGEAFEVDLEETDYRDYEPEEDEFEALYELEELNEESELVEEVIPDAKNTVAEPEGEAKKSEENETAEAAQNTPAEAEQQLHGAEVESEPPEPEEVSESSEKTHSKHTDNVNQE